MDFRKTYGGRKERIILKGLSKEATYSKGLQEKKYPFLDSDLSGKLDA